MKLNVQIPLIIGAVVFITSSAVSFVSLQISSKILEATILDVIEAKTSSNAELLSVTLNGDLNVLREIANRTTTRSMNFRVVRSSLVPDIPRINALDMALIYPDGIAHYVLENTTADLGDREYIKQAMAGKNSIGVVVSRVTNQIVVVFAVPVFQSDAPSAPVIGVVIARKDGGRTLSDIVVNLKSSMPSGYSYMVDNNGTFIAHSDTELVTSQFNPITETETTPSLKPWADMIETALKQKNGVSRYTYEGKEMIGQYAEVPGYSWVLFSSIERSDIDKQLAAMRIILLIICFIVSVTLAGVLVFVSSRTVLVSMEERERAAHEATERRKEIENLMNALKNSSETRTAFLSNISNKMANPINTIIKLSSVISHDKEVSEEIRKSTERINDSGVMLFEVVYDIIDILKIEAGKLQVHPVKYHLPHLIYDITVHYLMLVENKPVQYQLILDEDMPLQLIGDELRIRHICQHLLDNAFKFTLKGTIAVHVSCRKKNEYVWLTIKISDSGIGIEEDELEALFAGYGRINTDDKTYKGGTGLGLSISKKIAELMKGTLVAHSEKNKGTVFTICVPQKLVSEETIGKETAEQLMNFKYSKN